MVETAGLALTCARGRDPNLQASPLALQAPGLDQVENLHRPWLLSDNGPSYVSFG